MSDTRHATVAGGIIFICILAALAGVMWLSRSGIFRNDYEVNVLFSNVQGLSEGDGVKVDGSLMGQVKEIRLVREGAVVVLNIRKEVKIPQDSKFMLESELMKVGINIYRGAGTDMLKNGDSVKGENKNLFDAFYQLSEKGDRAFAGLFTPENIAAFALTIREMSKTIEDLRIMINENRQSLNVTLKNLEATSGQVNALFTDNRQGIQQTVKQLGQSTENLSRLLAQTDTLLSDVSAITGDIRRGRGTVGKLVTQDSVYRDIADAAASLKKLAVKLSRVTAKTETLVTHADSLVIDVKKDPKKYFKMKVF